MTRPIVTIPPMLARELQYDWDIDWRGQSAGETTQGVSQTVRNAFPRFVGTLRFAPCGEEIARWRAIRAFAQGRVGIYRILLNDPVTFTPEWDGLTFDDGAFFSDGVGFADQPFWIATEAAAAGATTIKLTGDVAPKVGQFIGHGDWPAQVTWVKPGYEIGVQMPLRAAISAGDKVYYQGTGLFEVVSETDGNPEYGFAKVSSVEVAFQEVLVR